MYLFGWDELMLVSFRINFSASVRSTKFFSYECFFVQLETTHMRWWMRNPTSFSSHDMEKSGALLVAAILPSNPSLPLPNPHISLLLRPRSLSKKKGCQSRRLPVLRCRRPALYEMDLRRVPRSPDASPPSSTSSRLAYASAPSATPPSAACTSLELQDWLRTGGWPTTPLPLAAAMVLTHQVVWLHLFSFVYKSVSAFSVQNVRTVQKLARSYSSYRACMFHLLIRNPYVLTIKFISSDASSLFLKDCRVRLLIHEPVRMFICGRSSKMLMLGNLSLFSPSYIEQSVLKLHVFFCTTLIYPCFVSRCAPCGEARIPSSSPTKTLTRTHIYFQISKCND